MKNKISFPHLKEKGSKWLSRCREDGLKLHSELLKVENKDFYWTFVNWICFCEVFKIEIANTDEVNHYLSESWKIIREKELAWINRESPCKECEANCTKKKQAGEKTK